ncbi:RNA polymerase subunit sigma-70, partial [candidate division KSB1 bacterium]|nr:RNA polymerase subunit sigma-70 [candidate division KSB1 bacterium]
MRDLITSKLLNQREQLLAYVRRKVSDSALAEDVLQDSLLKALRAAPELRDEEKLVPWFYRILNNAITDVYRRRQVEA